MNKTYYEILGVSETSTQEEISLAFRKLAKQYHPDLNHSDNVKEMFEAAYEAYDILRDSAKRSLYDERLKASRNYYSQNQSFSNTSSCNTNENSRNGSYSEARDRQYHEYQAKARSKAKEYAQKDYKSFAEEVWGVVKKVAKGTASATSGLVEGVAIGAAQGCLVGLYKLAIFAVLLIVFAGIPLCVMTCQSSIETNQREDKFADIYNKIDNGAGLYFREYPYHKESYSFTGKKILIVDMYEKEIYRRFWFINEKYQATRDDEIDYLLQVDKNNVVVGNYTDGANALRNDYTLRIVDYQTKTTVDIIKGKGDEPPMTKRNSGSVGGGNDLDEKLEKWFGTKSK